MANVPTTSWDETSPAGSANINQGDNRIREMKGQIREVVGVDHDFPSSGQASDNGQHLQVTLQEQADLGTGAEGATILGSQTVGGKGELVYSDEDDNDIQLTKAGVAYPSQSTVKADWLTIMALVYPIGSVVTLGVTTNPGTLYGVGTWTAITGEVIVGKAAAGTFNTLDGTGGAETIDSSHTHTGTTDGVTLNDGGGDDTAGALDTKHTHDFTSDTGGSATLDILQPYIVKYVWQRTS